MSRAPLRRGSAGLISAGGVAQSFLVRLPAIVSTIGFVKASSLRVASRIANTLHAGRGVVHYSDLDRCTLIWIAVPDAGVDRVVRDLAAQIRPAEKRIILCGSCFDSRALHGLHAGGASVASLNAMTDDTLIAEGDAGAMLELRKLINAGRHRLIEIRSHTKPLYVAGLHLAQHLTLPWIGAAVESFRAAGFSRSEAAETVDQMVGRAMRAYAKAGRKAWNASASAELKATMEPDLESLHARDPKLAALYSSGVSIATRYFDVP